ncbi:MAG: gliding motility lipoprotein GldD [Flavobacteriales bacterium]|nr:gliding motility lipoprotein GldD [Flavobacteriales bacterium]
MKYIYSIISILILSGCQERFSPKPNGYLRIHLEPKAQTIFNLTQCPFNFHAPSYWKIQNKSVEGHNCWIDLDYINQKATIHLTYKTVSNNVFNLIEESRTMVYKHTLKADEITEKRYQNNSNNTYGTLYDIYGETASSVQFHITDSTNHFLRGALYFSVTPNQDSLRPIINYLREDIMQIMETLEWVNQTALKEEKTDT